MLRTVTKIYLAAIVTIPFCSQVLMAQTRPDWQVTCVDRDHASSLTLKATLSDTFVSADHIHTQVKGTLTVARDNGDPTSFAVIGEEDYGGSFSGTEYLSLRDEGSSLNLESYLAYDGSSFGWGDFVFPDGEKVKVDCVNDLFPPH